MLGMTMIVFKIMLFFASQLRDQSEQARMALFDYFLLWHFWYDYSKPLTKLDTPD
jgi:hypothetical protein